MWSASAIYIGPVDDVMFAFGANSDLCYSLTVLDVQFWE